MNIWSFISRKFPFIITSYLLLFTLAQNTSALDLSNDKNQFDFSSVTKIAKDLSESSHITAKDFSTTSLKTLTYDDYRMIRFKPEHSLWKNEALFQVQFFHPGFLFQHPVSIFQIEQGKVTPIPFSSNLFKIEKQVQDKISTAGELGFAGFKFTYPLHKANIQDDVSVFLGASYFRLVGRKDHFGISARGLAINTAEDSGEEFPSFTRFWLVKPDKNDSTVIFYALLESKSLTGAYQFTYSPGKKSSLECIAKIFIREPGIKIGIAPLTSMFLRGEGSQRGIKDFRPEIHDSDGLLLHTSTDQNLLFRPLSNPTEGVRISRFLDVNPQGFGLVQRDRNYENYLDLETRQEKRPDLWVEPIGDWGNGSVELIEIASDSEANDNIVAYWVPEKIISNELEFAYRITAGRSLKQTDQAYAVRSFAKPLQSENEEQETETESRHFVIDFRSTSLAELDSNQPINPEIYLTNASFKDLTIQKDENTGDWRVTFVGTRTRGTSVDIRLHLSLHGESLSENWLYLWDDKL